MSKELSDRYSKTKKVAELFGEAAKMLKEDGMSDEVATKFMEAQSLSLQMLADEEKGKQDMEFEQMVHPTVVSAIESKMEVYINDKYYPLEEEAGVFKIKLRRQGLYGGMEEGVLFIFGGPTFGGQETLISWKPVAPVSGQFGEARGESKNKADK